MTSAEAFPAPPEIHTDGSTSHAVAGSDLLRDAFVFGIENRPGVYFLQNIETLKLYVGSSKTVRARLLRHFSQIWDGTHHSIKIRNSVRKHGPDKFVCGLIEYCDAANLIAREQFWLDFFDSQRRGYNTRPKVERNDGIVHSLQFREKIRSIMRTPERIEMSRKSIAKAAKHPRFIANLRTMASRNKGKKKDVSFCNRVRSGKNRPDVLLKQSKSSKRMWESDAYREAWQSGMKRAMADPTYWEKVSAGLRKTNQRKRNIRHWIFCCLVVRMAKLTQGEFDFSYDRTVLCSLKYRKNISMRSRRLWADPRHRANIQAKMRKHLSDAEIKEKWVKRLHSPQSQLKKHLTQIRKRFEQLAPDGCAGPLEFSELCIKMLDSGLSARKIGITFKTTHASITKWIRMRGFLSKHFPASPAAVDT